MVSKSVGLIAQSGGYEVRWLPTQMMLMLMMMKMSVWATM
jgi:hypothetical protein